LLENVTMYDCMRILPRVVSIVGRLFEITSMLSLASTMIFFQADKHLTIGKFFDATLNMVEAPAAAPLRVQQTVKMSMV
jgi:hypothetical protein